jgi:CRP/FNR family transcriptional regulator, cyclic AMP receptor protein
MNILIISPNDSVINHSNERLKHFKLHFAKNVSDLFFMMRKTRFSLILTSDDVNMKKQSHKSILEYLNNINTQLELKVPILFVTQDTMEGEHTNYSNVNSIHPKDLDTKLNHCVEYLLNSKDRKNTNILDKAEILELKEGEIIIKEGDVEQSMYWIRQGKVEVLISTPDGERSVAILGEGETIGELSFFDNRPRSATIRTLTSCKFLKIDQKAFDNTMNDIPPWLRKMLLSLCDRIRMSNIIKQG